MNTILLSLFMLLSPPDSTKVYIPVHHDFCLESYMGVWYECARLDHKFERGLDFVHIEYNKEDSSDVVIRMLNLGYNMEDKKWKRFEGKAKATGKPNTIRVSFVPLIWSELHVLYYDLEYQYAIVTDGSPNYLWIMSRHRIVPSEKLKMLLEIAEKAGFDTSKLIYPKQDNPPKNEE